MIKVTNLSVSYGDKVVSRLPHLELARGHVVGVVGESGSGKSQAAIAMLGLSAASGATVRGSIQLDDLELTGLSQRGWRAIRGQRISMIMQSPRASLTPTLRLGSLFARTLRQHGVPRSEVSDRMVNALREVALEEALLDRYAHQVSGGQAQRFAIALVAALGSEVLIADEPTSALDVTVQAEVMDVLARLQARSGTAILFISHDLALVSQLADEVVVMSAGSVVEQGSTSSVLRDPQHQYTRSLLAAVPRIEAGLSS